MKEFLKKTFLFSLLFLAVVVVLAFTLPSNPESYNQAYRLKTHLMETTSSPRMILVGGSNVAFGFDSKMMEDSLKIRVINNGLHAGIGLKFMIDDLFSLIGPGDILLICPEYNQFFGKLAYGGLPLTEVVTSITPEKIVRLNLPQVFAVVSNIPGNMKSRLQYNFSYLIHKKNPLSDAVYSLGSFNAYGDMCRHWDLPATSYTQLSHIDDAFNTTIARRFIKQLQMLEEKGCRVYLCPPALSSSSYHHMEDNIEEVFRFCERAGVPFLTPARQYVLADTLCFDTPYHLTRSGTILRTQELIKDLRNYMNK